MKNELNICIGFVVDNNEVEKQVPIIKEVVFDFFNEGYRTNIVYSTPECFELLVQIQKPFIENSKTEADFFQKLKEIFTVLKEYKPFFTEFTELEEDK